MYCIRCGTKNPEEARFCCACGSAIQAELEADQAHPVASEAVPGGIRRAALPSEALHGLASSPESAATNSVAPSLPSPASLGSYWYGYLYAAFCAFMAYASLAHVASSLSRPIPKNDTEAVSYFWTFLGLSLLATGVFAFSAYRLLRRKAAMRLVYLVATLHALNVLARGLRPAEIAMWLAISGSAIVLFRRNRRRPAAA